ncbi:type VI secretion system protein TssA [Bosea sp. (in: a-proteobacteria)]|uniref:type VI secretion system protein TssA n=1 Tax=Bosea sp. (in: a-proteobacteria) TaxID=1871050 RepID=UPI002FC71488
MAALNFADLARPVSADDPCGPDPDGDPDFMNVMARLEVALPTSYFRREDDGRQVAFDRTTIDFPVAFADLDKILKQSRDVRVLVIAGKLCLLNRDIPGFSACLGLIADGLLAHWDEIHPRAEDGDFILREVALQSLDELATVVLPLQHAPLLISRRIGPLAFRSQLVATGAIQAGEDEQHPEASAIQSALADADIGELTAMFGHVVAIRDAIAQVRTIWVERAGVDQAVSFPRLSGLVSQIISFLEPVVGRRAPDQAGEPVADAAAPAPASAGAVLPPGSCASVPEARAALGACLAYFRRAEPSSPAVLLIGQAQRLIGKSLIEVIQIMFPEHVDKAILEIGTEPRFQLPLERLNASDGYDDSGASGGYGSGEDEQASEAWEEATAEEGETEAAEAEGAAGEGGSEAADQPAGPARPVPAEPVSASAPAAVTAATRAEAVSRMKAVAVFYRQVEPSNPIPLLMDKACALAQHDFMSLLSDILPEVGIRQSSDE